MRPIISPETFRENGEFLQKVISELETEYNAFAKRNGGIINVKALERVYKTVKKHFEPLDYAQECLVEGIFDSFNGALTMTGNSVDTFKILWGIVK